MANRWIWALALALIAAPSAAPAQAPGASSALDEGVRRVQEGDFEGGIQVLDALVQEIGSDVARAEELSRSYLFLGIAYLSLSEGADAKARFVEAVRLKNDLQLNPKDYPPRIIDAFEKAREAALKDIVIQLPAEKAPPDAPVFFAAVRAGDFSAVSTLIQRDASLVNWADEEFGATALHWCALRGHEAIAALLLGNGAKPSRPNLAGETPMQVARRSNQKELVRLFEQVESPIYAAIRNGDLASVRRLLDGDPSLLNQPDAEFGAAPLHWAALRGQAAITSFLLNAGADPQKRNAAGETALEVARRSGRAEVEALLAPATSR